MKMVGQLTSRADRVERRESVAAHAFLTQAGRDEAGNDGGGVEETGMTNRPSRASSPRLSWAQWAHSNGELG